MTPHSQMRLRRLLICAAVIVAGLALRRFGYAAGLPFIVVKYGGSLMWAMMVYLLVGAAFPRLPVRNIALFAATIAGAMEFFRLFHTPWLDAFRLTPAGALLLGRVFSPWNLLAYAGGIAGGTALEREVAKAE